MKRWLRWLFFCPCTRLGKPITVPNRIRLGQWKAGQTYIVCLDCGTEYPYDWDNMRRLEQPKARKVERHLLPLINADER
ncbi:MAG TPA: hypothetical protein VGQ12_08050 [Candidatus Angelobacter sp.]|nr:hypothetical protein [Candidatus Angelobacter sp.]